MGLFFNNILIIALPGNGFEEKFVQKWNDWVNRWKSVCIDRVRGNAVRSPKIHSERVDEFFRGLIHLGLLGNVDEQVANVEEKADAILTENKKPPIS